MPDAGTPVKETRRGRLEAHRPDHGELVGLAWGCLVVLSITFSNRLPQAAEWASSSHYEVALLDPWYSQTVNLAERLGFAADDRVLILHADDVGSSHAANAAAFECLEVGSLTSGSVMVPAAWFPEVAAYAREHPRADLGVHLTLTSEYSSYRWRALTDRSAALKG